MLHSKQWHYSLHRDFQNCYSTRRSPTGFFSSNSSSNSTRVPIHHTAYELHPSTYNLHVHTTSTSREFSIQNTILHAEDKELFKYYITVSRNSTHRRQGDLLEMHPCVLQDLPVTFQASQPQVLTKATPVTPVTPIAPETFQSFQSFQTLQRHSGHSSHSWPPAFPGNSTNSTSSSISRDSTLFQHSPIRMHILQFDWFPQKLHRVPIGQLQTLQTFILQRKGDVVISVKRASVKMSRWHIIQNRINSLFRLSSDNTNCKNDI